METKKKYVKLFACYVLWGFQPLYWTLLKEVDPYTILAVRIVFAAVFSVLLLFASGKISLLSSAFRDKRQMKFLAPAALILLADWTVFIIVVNNGHVLDASLGYYICPLVVFAVGIVLFHEKAKKLQIAALAVAAAGVVVCAVSLGDIPAVSLFLAVNWAVYSSIKKYVHLEGIVSIAVETLLMLPAAIFFLIVFRLKELVGAGSVIWLWFVLSGIVTALPMFLFSDSLSALPLIVMCFANYLAPTFNLICGLVLGEVFTKTQIVSLVFFIAAIIMFSYSQFNTGKKA